MPRCEMEDCGFEGPPEEFDPAGITSVYHDFRCPDCGTTKVDTSDINAEWAAQGQHYPYGDDNFLRITAD